MSSIERVDIKAQNTALEMFRAFRAWAEKVVAERGETLEPGWYKDGPEDMPELYERLPEADDSTQGGS